MHSTRNIFISILIAVVIFGGVYFVYVSKRIPPLESEKLKPFSQQDQIVPDGTKSLEINQALARFGFSKPLPFFDPINVTQSLDVQNTEASTSSLQGTYLSYRILRKNATIIRDAYIDYFQSTGLGKNIKPQQNGSIVFVLPRNPPALLRLLLLEQPFAVTRGDEVITAVLTLVPLTEDSNSNQ